MRSFTDAFAARILIADDQQSNLRLLEFTLRRAGYVAVSSTIEPLEVCELHQRNRYDLILLDLQMPCMNGFEVMAALRRIEGAERAAILVLSADPSQTTRALEAGAADFLSKPFDLTELLLRVRRLLQKAMQTSSCREVRWRLRLLPWADCVFSSSRRVVGHPASRSVGGRPRPRDLPSGCE